MTKGKRNRIRVVKHMISHRRMHTFSFAMVLWLCGVIYGSTVAQGASGYFDYPITSEMAFFTAGTGGNCDTCIWIVAEGEIVQDTPAKFNLFLRNLKVNDTIPSAIHLNSQGGNLLAGIKLGELIRKNKMNTWVAKTVGEFYDNTDHIGYAYAKNEAPRAMCASACAYAFLGGVVRYALSSHYENSIAVRGPGILGVHQFYSEDGIKNIESKLFDAVDISRDQFLTGILLEYVVRMGVDPQLVAIASGVPPWDKMHWLSDAELRLTKIESAEKQISVGISVMNGNSASVTVKFKTATSDISVQLFCTRMKNLMMSAAISTRDVTDLRSIEQWSIYDGWRLKFNELDLEIIKKELKVIRVEGHSSIELLFQIGNANIEELSKLKEFAFESDSGRYASEAAWDLSFALPKDFDGMMLLPRSCLTE